MTDSRTTLRWIYPSAKKAKSSPFSEMAEPKLFFRWLVIQGLRKEFLCEMAKTTTPAKSQEACAHTISTPRYSSTNRAKESPSQNTANSYPFLRGHDTSLTILPTDLQPLPLAHI